LKFFGHKAFTLIPTKNRQKLDPHFIKCIVLGYSEKSKTYRLMDKSYRRIIISQDVLFDESSIYDGQMHCPSNMKVKKEDFAFDPNFLKPMTNPTLQSNSPIQLRAILNSPIESNVQQITSNSSSPYIVNSTNLDLIQEFSSLSICGQEELVDVTLRSGNIDQTTHEWSHA
jgi:hypothetical protein